MTPKRPKIKGNGLFSGVPGPVHSETPPDSAHQFVPDGAIARVGDPSRSFRPGSRQTLAPRAGRDDTHFAAFKSQQ